MKKLLLSLVAVAGIAVASNAQACTTPPSSLCTPLAVIDSPGLSPVSDSLPCFVKGQSVNTVINFKNYDTTTVVLTPGNPPILVTVDSIKIDSILLTPGYAANGLCWNMQPSTTIANSGIGCISVTGTLAAGIPAGQYRLHIALHAYVNGLTVGMPYTSEGLGLNYYIRVIAADSTCPAVDTVGAPAFISYYGETVGINNISTNVSQVSVQPNPFGTATTITFSAEKRENYSLKLINLLGEVVYSKDITATVGKNAYTVENKGYANGVYLLSLTNGKSTITKRVVISE